MTPQYQPTRVTSLPGVRLRSYRGLPYWGSPPLRTRKSNLFLRTPSIRTVNRQTKRHAQIARRVDDLPSSASGSLQSLLISEEEIQHELEALEVDFLDFFDLSAPSQFPTDHAKRSQMHPSATPSPPMTSAFCHPRSSVNSSSWLPTSRTSELGPGQQSPFRSAKRARLGTTLNTSHGVDGDSLSRSTPNSENLPVRLGVQQAKPFTPRRAQTILPKVLKLASQVSRPANSPILSPQSRKWESVSPTSLEILEKVASDSESLLRLTTDGSVSAGNLEGLVSRIVTGTADTCKDGRFRDAFLTVYQHFATSERLFEILKRRFVSTKLVPAHIRSRFK